MEDFDNLIFESVTIPEELLESLEGFVSRVQEAVQEDKNDEVEKVNAEETLT